MQFGIKRLPRDAQQFGCPADIAMAVIHHTLHVVALQFVQRLYLLSLIHCILQRAQQLVVVPRLGNEVGGACLEALHRQLHVGIGCDEHHGQLRMQMSERA